jgi:hypothetical protein
MIKQAPLSECAIRQGRTRVENLLDSDDVCYMLGALTALGIELDETREENRVEVTGCGGIFPVAKQVNMPRLRKDNCGRGGIGKVVSLAVHLSLRQSECRTPSSTISVCAAHSWEAGVFLFEHDAPLLFLAGPLISFLQANLGPVPASHLFRARRQVTPDFDTVSGVFDPENPPLL